jgi:NitT/TauT family transport system substrate-binding protein
MAEDQDSMSRWRRPVLRLLGATAIAAGLGVTAARAAEKLNVGVLKLVSSGPVFMAQELGYFREAGLDVELKFFEAAQPVAVATVSGDVDVGVTGVTAGFYNLAGKGALKIIAASAREETGYKLVAVVASRKAAEAGLKRMEDLPGRAVAVTQIGSTFHYSLGILAEKHGFEIGKVRVLPMLSIPNLVSSLKGSQVDAAIMPATAATPLIASGDAVLIGWADEAPWQVTAMFTAPKTIASRRQALEKFVQAYQRGTQAFHESFLAKAPGGGAGAGPNAERDLAIIAKYTGQSVESVRTSIPFIDPKGRLLVGDIHRQVKWYQGQKLVDAAVDAKSILDLSFVDGHMDVPN